MNVRLAEKVLIEVLKCGVDTICLSPSTRNSPFVERLVDEAQFTLFYWPEERSGSFFALGKAVATGLPVAVITTSGTAVGELLPACMEAYYCGIPLLLITADRPRHFRGCGAPQSAEQKNIFGVYAPFSLDIAEDEVFSLKDWDQKAPAHLNVCFEEPKEALDLPSLAKQERMYFPRSSTYEPQYAVTVSEFLSKYASPFVVLGGIRPHLKGKTVDFLKKLGLPIYAEGISQCREAEAIKHLLIPTFDSTQFNAVLKIGSVPTCRFWRDLQEKELMPSLSISEGPYSGLTKGTHIETDLQQLFSAVEFSNKIDKVLIHPTIQLAHEPLLIHNLSKLIPKTSIVYLGNSLPIREWDLAATREDKGFTVHANRGVNGIDGQISTFLGLATESCENWGIFGDLTTLYDLVAPWILPQVAVKKIAIVVINNGGGKIFEKMFSRKEYRNLHSLSFLKLAEFWSLKYECWETIPEHYSLKEPTLIEVISH